MEVPIVNNYESIKDLISALLNNIQASNFNNDDLGNFKNQIQDFWKDFIKFMNEKEGTFEGDFNHQEDFETIGYYINKFIDFIVEDEDKSSKLYQAIENKIKGEDTDKNIDLSAPAGVKQNIDYFWNESVNKAIAKFLYNFDLKYNKRYEDRNGNEDFDPEDNGEPIKLNNGIPVNGDVEHFQWSDIANADAGLNFKNDGTVNPQGPPWVKPQYNIDGKLYKHVRGIDKIISVLNSNKELQFTEMQGDDDAYHWLRLLMPKYLRYVEVEDLNRNFWVIGQTITAICSFLFDDNSPIKDLLKDILDELPQLWENVFYLWMTAAAISQKPKYDKIHVEELFLPNNSYEHFLKFDNFNSSDGLVKEQSDETKIIGVDYEALKENLRYLINTYPNSNLCIIPKIRLNNYKKNYFSGIFLPAVYFYDRNKDTYFYIKLKWPEGHLDNDNVIFDLTNSQGRIFSNEIYGVYENDKKSVYEYHFPLSDIVSAQDEEKTYYGLLQLLMDISITYDVNTYKFKINSLYFRIKDRARSFLIDDENAMDTSPGKIFPDNTLISLKFNSLIETPVWISEENSGQEYNMRNYSSTVPPQVEVQGEIYTCPIKKGFYQGELLSYWRYIQGIQYAFESKGLWGFPAYTPKQIVLINDLDNNNWGGENNVYRDFRNSLSQLSEYDTIANEGKETRLDFYNYVLSLLPYSLYLEMLYQYGERGTPDIRLAFMLQFNQNEHALFTGMKNVQWMDFYVKNSFYYDSNSKIKYDGNFLDIPFTGDIEMIKNPFGENLSVSLEGTSLSNGIDELTLNELFNKFDDLMELKGIINDNIPAGTGDSNSNTLSEDCLLIRLALKRKNNGLLNQNLTLEIQLRKSILPDRYKDVNGTYNVGQYLTEQHEINRGLLSTSCHKTLSFDEFKSNYTVKSYLPTGPLQLYLQQPPFFTAAEIDNYNRFLEENQIHSTAKLIENIDFRTVSTESGNLRILTYHGYDKVICLNNILNETSAIQSNENRFYYGGTYRSDNPLISWNGKDSGMNYGMTGLIKTSGNVQSVYNIKNSYFQLAGVSPIGGISSGIYILTPKYNNSKKLIYYNNYFEYSRAREANSNPLYEENFNNIGNEIGRDENGIKEYSILASLGGSQILVMTEYGRPLDEDNWLIVKIDYNRDRTVPLFPKYKRLDDNDWTYNFEYDTFALRNTAVNSGRTDFTMKQYLEQIGESDIPNKMSDIDGSKLNRILQQSGNIRLGQETSNVNTNHMLGQIELAYYLGDDWYGRENGADYFVNPYWNRDVIVSILNPAGEWSITHYVRDFNPYSANYLKWFKFIITDKDGNDHEPEMSTQAEISRENYVVISNTQPGYNFEKYKTNGKNYGLIKKFNGETFDETIDDDIPYDVEWLNGEW